MSPTDPALRDGPLTLDRRRLLTGLGTATVASLAGCPDDSTSDGGRALSTRDGVLYVDNEPFIPTGMYFWPDVLYPSGDNPFEAIASYGLTAVTAPYRYVRLDDERVTGQPDVDELRVEAERLELYYFLESPPPSELEGKSDHELKSLFRSLTDRVAGSRYFLGWAFDEPAWRGIGLDLIDRATDAIRTHSVEQLIYFIYAPVDERWSDSDWPNMERYSAKADIIGHTFYPVESGLPWEGYIGRSRLEDYGWYTDRLRSWVDADTPIWLHQQGHRVGDLEDPPTDEGRRPNQTETRFMTFQGLVHGASGIFYFPGSKLGGAIPFDAPVWDQYIREAAKEVRALQDVFLTDESAETVTTSSDAVATLAGHDNGDTVILAVYETDGQSESVGFDLSEKRDGTFSVRGEDRSVSVEKGTFEDDFDGYEVTIYVEE